MTLLSEIVVVGGGWNGLDPNLLSQIMSTTNYPIGSIAALNLASNQALATGGPDRTMGGVIAPEAPYVIPPLTPTGRVVDAQFLNEAIAHLKALDPATRLLEFYDMYTNAANPYYLDFDQFPGSYNITYFSAAEGGMVTESVYASFGNFVYGAVGRLADIPREVLETGANWTQHGQPGVAFWNRHDDPHDQVNVTAGIESAIDYIWRGFDPSTFFEVGPPSSPVGTSAPDAIQGSAAADHLAGSAGNDRIDGDAGNDDLWGDDGRDIIFGGLGLDDLAGGAGDDAMSGGASNDYLFGEAGNDALYGDGGDDYIAGGDGNDVIHGGQGNDHFLSPASGGLEGGAGDDLISGGDGLDEALGGDGNDTIVGGTGNDNLFGDRADRTYNNNNLTSVVQYGTGKDIVYGDDGNDTIFGGADNDTMNGNVGADSLIGGQGSDLISGGRENDIVAGGQGDDRIYGDLGNDILSGDLGNDSLYGGDGADVFAMNAAMNVDRVYDFSRPQGDVVDVTGAYSTYQSGADTYIDFGNGSQMILVGVQLSSLTAGWIV